MGISCAAATLKAQTEGNQSDVWCGTFYIKTAYSLSAVKMRYFHRNSPTPLKSLI